MDQFINQNLEDREQTRAALTQKLETLELRLRESVEKVRETIRRSTDIPYQVRQRPWGMFGLSVMLGCAVGRIMTCGRSRDRSEAEESAARVARSVDRGISPNLAAQSNGSGDYAQQVSVMKGATIGAMASILSELARQVVSPLLAQLENYSRSKTAVDSLNNKTTDVTRSVNT